MKYLKLFEEYQEFLDKTIKEISDSVFDTKYDYRMKNIRNVYTKKELNKKLSEYKTHIHSFSKNGYIKIYRGLDCSINDILYGDENSGFCSSYTIRKDIAEDYGHQIISGYIKLNEINWNATLDRLLEKIDDYIDFGEVENPKEPFSVIDFEKEIIINSDKLLNDLRINDIPKKL